MAGEETGGPLVNLSGQAIGINVAGTGSGLHHTGFAVPIERGPGRREEYPGLAFGVRRRTR